MYFVDRVTLGKTLAQGLQDLRGKEAVILCLKESSLLTCLSMAMQLRAWVFPLLYVPLYAQDNERTVLGVVSADGEFTASNQNITRQAAASSPDLERQKQTALEVLRQKLSGYGMKLDNHSMDGRDVVLAADVLSDPQPLIVGRQLLDAINPKSITVVAGNVTPLVADQIRVSASKTTVLDVLSGVVSDDDRYFQQPDAYSLQEQYKLAQHIATYWQ
ncbi:hypothetical protein BH09PAT4_BH09PAT4_07560 [soil metagenome]